MSGRAIALGGSLAMIALLGLLTLDVMARSGFTILVAISLAIVAMVGFGVLGALFNPPDK